MPTNYTSNYHLNQWEARDKVQRTDFNADNVKIDAAIKAEADARTAADQAINQALAKKADSSTVSALSGTLTNHTSALAKKGNCQIYTTSYVGSGSYGEERKNTLSFPGKPLVVVLAGQDGTLGIMVQGQEHSFCSKMTGGVGAWTCAWSGNSVSWYNHMSVPGQMNQMGSTYLVVAFLKAD